jgi:hypothetical protein
MELFNELLSGVKWFVFKGAFPICIGSMKYIVTFLAILAVFSITSTTQAQVWHRNLFVQDSLGNYTILEAPPGGGSSAFPAVGTLVTTSTLSNYLPLAGGTLSTSSLATLLSLTSTKAAPATVLSMSGGRVVMQSTASTPSSGTTIATNVAAAVVGDNGVTNSPATITLPAGTEGQILYITTQDPDGVTITTAVNSVSVNVTIADSEVGTFMYLGGQWRLQH